MRMPSLKSWIIYAAVFAAGFATCLAYTLAFLYTTHYFRIKSTQSKIIAHLSAPEFYSPQPAVFDFKAVCKDGSSLKFQEYRGRVVVLNIWATWCVPCMAELPSLGKLAAHYSPDKDVAVICLSQESANAIFKNSGALDSEAPIFSLDEHQLPSVYKTGGIPATFVIDTHGMIVLKHVGAADWSHPSVIKFIDSLRQRPNTALEPTATAP